MIRRLLIVLTAFFALGSLLAVSVPAKAATCTVLSAKARSWSEATAAERATTKLKHKVDRSANKNDLSTVRVDNPSSSCTSQGVLFVCAHSVKVCG